MSVTNCIFCSIVEGRIPAYVIYQDKNLLAIMDRYPSSKGHVLVLLKRHVADIYGLTEDEAKESMILVQKLARKMRDVLRMDGLNLVQNNGNVAGQEIDHYHMHLIPRYKNDGLKLSAKPIDQPLEELEHLAKQLNL